MVSVTTALAVIEDPYSDIEGFTPTHIVGGTRLRKLLLSIGVPYVCSMCTISDWNGKPLTLHVDHVNGDKRNNNRNNLRFLCPNCHSQSPTYCGRNVKGKRADISEDNIKLAHAHATRNGAEPSPSTLLKLIGRSQYTRLEYDKVVVLCEEAGLPIRKQVYVRSNTELPPLVIKPRKSKIEWDDDWLAYEIQYRSLLDIAQELGVSDNAVRKRCKSRGIEIPSVRREKPRARESRDSIKARLKDMHGTRAGYRLELKLGEGTCDECREFERNRASKMADSRRKNKLAPASKKC